MVKLTFAQVAPLIESAPPQLYGGTDRIRRFIWEGPAAPNSSTVLLHHRVLDKSPRHD
jgi:hypothetical protein